MSSTGLFFQTTFEVRHSRFVEVGAAALLPLACAAQPGIAMAMFPPPNVNCFGFARRVYTRRIDFRFGVFSDIRNRRLRPQSNTNVKSKTGLALLYTASATAKSSSIKATFSWGLRLVELAVRKTRGSAGLCAVLHQAVE